MLWRSSNFQVVFLGPLLVKVNKYPSWDTANKVSISDHQPNNIESKLNHNSVSKPLKISISSSRVMLTSSGKCAILAKPTTTKNVKEGQTSMGCTKSRKNKIKQHIKTTSCQTNQRPSKTICLSFAAMAPVQRGNCLCHLLCGVVGRCAGASAFTLTRLGSMQIPLVGTGFPFRIHVGFTCFIWFCWLS